MAITQAMTTSFKQQLLEGGHNFKTSGAGGNTFKIALYTNAASLDASSTVFTTSNEASGTNYVSGGKVLTNATPATSGTTAFCDFSDVTWSASSITARGALIYNTNLSNAAVAVLDFGADKTSTSGDFTVQFPTADATNAIIRLA
tara:strand:- start:5695 stop:6129 length:435 start_codon:yes stop_codon:yes gene_type:complete